MDKVPTQDQLQEALDNGELSDIPLSGYRSIWGGKMYNIGGSAHLWAFNTTGSTHARSLYLNASSSGWTLDNRVYGFSVRLLAE